ncbi:MAG: hypothetical protein ACJAQW_000036 [Paracoccaceae bacterium]|jgi:hypothetical protein
MMQLPLPEMTRTLAQLMQTRLGVRRGATFRAKIDHAGRLLPPSLRREALFLIETEQRTAHPKLRMQIDPARVMHAYKGLSAYLRGLDPADRRKGIVLGALASLSFNLLLFGGALTAFLMWYDGQ